MKRLIATILLPLSLVPVALAVPHVAEQREEFQARYVDRGPLAAPEVRAVRRPAVPAYRDRVPVLVYHGISDEETPWTLTQETFAAHVAALDAAGFHAVSAEDFARFSRGEPVSLPERPVLITFDDGRLDSFRGADAVLERHGMRATMFAIAGALEEHSSVYLGADELREMAQSGRWDVQLHAGEGHRQIADARGRERPYYAARQAGESVGEYAERVRGDVDGGGERLDELVPEAGDELFAVPYSDYGQAPGGDPRLARIMLRTMTGRFTAVFVQRSDLEPTRRGQQGLLTRFEPSPETTAADLLRTLRRGTAPHEEA